MTRLELFLDKLFRLGHETTVAHAWMNKGSPSKGFLSGAVGPFAGIYQSIVGAGWVNWMFMLVLLGLAVVGAEHPWAWSLVDPDQLRPPLPLAHLRRSIVVTRM